MDGFPFHEVFLRQKLLICAVRHISLWTPRLELILVVPLPWQLHIKSYGDRDNGQPGITSLYMLNIKIQVDKKTGSWIWISPDGSHGSSKWATSQTGRSIFNSRKSRKVHAPSGTKSCVVWFSCGIFNLQPLPAERSKTLRKMSVKMWQWLLGNRFKLLNEQKQPMKQVHYISIILNIK